MRADAPNPQKDKAQCILCLKITNLCESHIIPEFLYQTLYDGKHRFCVINANSSKFEQKGIREKLLCLGCETYLSKYETYAKEVIFGGTELIFSESHRITKVINVDYAKLKVFALSILWRAAVSQNESFAAIKLGRKHEVILRSMVITGSPGKSYEYPLIISFNKSIAKSVIDGLMIPGRLAPRLEGHKAYKFFLAGCYWVFFVSSHTNKLKDKTFSLMDTGELNIYKTDVPQDYFIQEILGQKSKL